MNMHFNQFEQSRFSLNVLARRDLYTFIQLCHATLNPGEEFLENWHVELMVSELMAIWRGEQRRVIFNLPPQYLKSLCISVAFVAWVLGHDPTKRFMVVSYGQELAEKLGRDTRTIMLSAWYQAMFPKTRLLPTRTAAHDFETTMGGRRMALSRGGPITGHGAHFVILDDPIKADEALSPIAREAATSVAKSTLFTRRKDPTKVAYILAMQRLHDDDLSGILLRQGGWRHVCLPAIALKDEAWTYSTSFGERTVFRAAGEVLHGAREPMWALHEVKTMQGEYHFNAQYLQDPIPLTGNLVKIDRMVPYRPEELPSEFEETLFSIDVANKAKEMSSWSVITHWGRNGREIFLLNVWRLKLSYRELKARIWALWQDLRPHRILVEDAAGGQQLIPELVHAGVPGVSGVTPKGDKAVRMGQAGILIEDGVVHVPDQAPWLGEYLHELAAFPDAHRHDDQVDSTSQALNWFREKRFTPGIIQFYREEAERLGLTPSVDLWTLRPPAGWGGTLYGINGDRIDPDADGLFRVTKENAIPLLRLGFVRADGGGA